MEGQQSSWHVLMPMRGSRTSLSGSDGALGQRRTADLGAGFDSDGTVNAQIADKAASTFWSYDTESKGTLDKGDLVSALGDMGALTGLPPKLIAETLALDTPANREKRFTLHEFLTMYMRLAQQQAKLAREGRPKYSSAVPEPPPGSESNPALRSVFGAYCQFARGTSRMMMSETSPAMVAQQLHRLSQDIGLVGEGGPLYSSSIDIAYVRCQTPGSHRLNYTQWLKALCILSDESGWDLFQLLCEHAHKLGTKGLPPPVDPHTMLPPKPGTHMAPLPQLRHSSSGAGEGIMPRPPSNAGNGPDSDGPAMWAQTMPPPGGNGGGFRGRPLSGAAQRPPRFNNLMSSSHGARDPWPAVGDVGAEPSSGEPGARSLSGEKSWSALELGQLDPNCLPPWLSQVLERLHSMESRVGLGDKLISPHISPHGGGVGSPHVASPRTYPLRPGRGSGSAAGGGDLDADAVVALAQRVQQAEAAAAAAAAACLGVTPPAGSDMAAALASLPPWLHQGYRDSGGAAAGNRQLQDSIQDLQRQLQVQRAESDALLRRVQHLESRPPGAAGSPGGGYAPTPGGEFDARLARCEARLDGHDADLVRLKGHPGGLLDVRVGEVEQQLKTYSVSLLATATSAASAGESAASAGDKAGQALSRLEALERRMEGAGGEGAGLTPEALAAAAARQAAAGNGVPTQQQLVAMGLEPRVAEQVSRLSGLGLDAQVWAEVMRRLVNIEQDTKQVDQKLSGLIANPGQVLAAGTAAKAGMGAGMPSMATQQMLSAGVDPRIVEQLAKMEALGIDPLPFAELIKRQDRTEQEVGKLTNTPAAAAAAAAAAKQQSPWALPSAAEQQMLNAGLDPKVVEQLGKLEAIGVDPLVFADMLRRQGNTEKELKALVADAAGVASSAAMQASGGAPTAAQQQMLKAGLDSKAVEALGKLEALGVDPLVFADVVRKQGESDQQLGRVLKNPVVIAAAAAAAAKMAAGGKPTVSEQEMLKAGLDVQVVEQLSKLDSIGIDPLLFAGLVKRQAEMEQAVDKLLKGPAAAAAAGGAPSPALQKLREAGVDAKTIEALGKLEALGVDPVPFAELLQRQVTTEQAVEELLKNPAALAASAARPGSGVPTAAEAQMLNAGMHPKVVEQLSKLETIGVDPLLFADMVKRQGETEQAVEKLLKSPAAAAAAGGAPSKAEAQMVKQGVDPRVAQELVKLAALGVDPLVFGEMVTRQGKTEQEVDGLMKGPAGAAAAAAAAKRAAGGAPSAAEQAMLKAGMDPRVVEELGKLEVLGVDPRVFADLMRRVAELEGQLAQVGQGRAEGGAVSELQQELQGVQQAVSALLQDVGEARQAVGAAQAAAAGAVDAATDAAQRADALAAFAEALAAKHDALDAEVKAGDAGGSGGEKVDGERMAQVEGDYKQITKALAELSGRCTAMERDLAMALTSYARIVDLKESENHMLDRHQQLHDEIETLKDNLRTVHDEVEQLTTAMVVAAPTITNTQNLPGVVKQSVVMGGQAPLGSRMSDSNNTAGSTPSRQASRAGGFPVMGWDGQQVPLPPGAQGLPAVPSAARMSQA